MAYLVTAQMPDGSEVTREAPTLADALNEAAKLTSEGNAHPVIRLINSSFELDVDEFMRNMNGHQSP